MKIKTPNLFIILFTIFFAGCNGQTKTEEKNQPQNNTQPAASYNNIELQAPDFSDATLNKYYSDYTTYIKKVVALIHDKDEAGTMKLFRDEGKQFDNQMKWEQKARSTPEKEQKFTTWLMQSLPYQKEIIQSEYYKKFNEEYYKNVKEKFKKMEEK